MTLAVVFNVHRGSARGVPAVAVVNVGHVPNDQVASSPPAGEASAHHRSTAAALAPGSRLRLDRLGLDAAITTVTTVGNVMQIPHDPHRLGWWAGGSAPGDASGTTVIVGHINYAGVSGALAVLPEARPGDPLVISAGDHDHHYRVVAVRSYLKSSGIPANVFSRTGRARLVLITCGGPFDSATGNYEDNIVAYAEPV
jgi:hypothetical protein